MALTRRSCVYVGLSGGVDSGVSAALLCKGGYDVTGVFIRIELPGYLCTAVEDRRDAIRVAVHLGIPFIDIDLSKEYQERVFTPALKAFQDGKTPNPDALCNREIKFGLLYEFAKKKGADYVATGHYARTHDGLLYTGNDPEKDQSYFLWTVPQDTLRSTFFPVGRFHKTQVRGLARTFKLPNADRKDSQGLCFLGPMDMEGILKKELRPTPGEVLDIKGNVIGCHSGAVLYTPGQRHGFILQAQSPDSPAHFVIKKDLAHNTITVSATRTPQGYTKTCLTLTGENWIGQIEDGSYQARYRYRQPLIPATFAKGVVTLHESHIVPEGQSLVMYDNDRCLGGGVVDKAELQVG